MIQRGARNAFAPGYYISPLALSPPSRSGYCPVRATHDSFLQLILRGAIAAGDVSLIGGFFDGVRNGFADAFVED